MDAFDGSFVRDYCVVVRAATRRLRDRCGRCGAEDIDMLAVVSRACSIVDSIAIYIWTRRAGPPRQCQPLSRRGCGNRPATSRLLGSQHRSRRCLCVLKEESAVEQQRRSARGTSQKSSVTMEVIANAVMSSTDRAWIGFQIDPGTLMHQRPHPLTANGW
jgi:hypothetical protein